ncbi:hypothetical protein CLOSPI_00452 [Thomasclavelia spiroformis DSM 1552]|uniref:Uncharacterized protein n=1 Tax=Thomasclavelia spiroformis DSM 1552 TaxID=428126 RepID=B1BZS5_9FIRM|nr:hypothetical protein CLOSPI_00452 [Thomasclavelia spiroformis DSM 1552]
MKNYKNIFNLKHYLKIIDYIIVNLKYKFFKLVNIFEKIFDKKIFSNIIIDNSMTKRVVLMMIFSELMVVED